MTFLVAAILLALWGIGVVSAYTFGGFIHLLLVAAIVLTLTKVIQGPDHDT